VSYKGTVKNGVVVLPPEAKLPGGAQVEGTPLETRANDPPFLQAILKLAKPRPDWPEDFALNQCRAQTSRGRFAHARIDGATTEFVLLELADALCQPHQRNEVLTLWNVVATDPAFRLVCATTELMQGKRNSIANVRTRSGRSRIVFPSSSCRSKDCRKRLRQIVNLRRRDLNLCWRDVSVQIGAFAGGIPDSPGDLL
jgi:hypothetical protein